MFTPEGDEVNGGKIEINANPRAGRALRDTPHLVYAKENTGPNPHEHSNDQTSDCAKRQSRIAVDSLETGSISVVTAGHA